MAMATTMSRASPANLKVLFVALLCAAVAASFLPRSSADASFVAQTCRKTSHQRLCNSILQSNNRSITATTVGELAVVALTAARNSTRRATTRAFELGYELRGTAAGDLVGQCRALYRDCLRATTDALGMVSTSASLFGRAADVASTFLGFPEKCGILFYTRRIASPLEQTNREMRTSWASRRRLFTCCCRIA